jgi:ABC-type lipoprotein release transport system permease subunit
MMGQMVTAVVRAAGHLQIEHTGFADNPGVYRCVADADAVIAAIEADPGVRRWAPRVITGGLARSATASAGVRIHGVQASREAKMTGVEDRLVEGGWLTGASSRRRREIVIGTKLATKLRARMGYKVVLNAQARADDGETEMTSGVFRVVGIFRMPSESMNEAILFINLDDAQALLGMGDDLSQVVVTLDDDETSAAVQTRMAEAIGGEKNVVRTWQDGNRTLVQMVDLFEASILVYVIIIFLGAAFGIINTMLMAVFERTREFGILRAVGTGRWALFRLVIYEALFISLLGTVSGIGLMGGLHAVWLRHGLDLSMFAESLSLFGSDAVILPVWQADLCAQAVFVVLVMGVLSALWPALRAARVQPAEAMRGG